MLSRLDCIKKDGGFMKKALLVFVTLLLLSPASAQAYSFQFLDLLHVEVETPNPSALETTRFYSTLDSNYMGSADQAYHGKFMIVDDAPGNSSSPVNVNYEFIFSGNLESPSGTPFGTTSINGPGVSLSGLGSMTVQSGEEIFLTNTWYNFEGLVSLDMPPGNDGWSKVTYSLEATAATPIPGAVWLLGSGLVGLVGIRRKMKA